MTTSLRESASRVIAAFKAHGAAKQTIDDLVTRRECEAAMLALEAALSTPPAEGMVLVPRQMHVDAETWQAVQFVVGGASEEEPFMDATLWVGEVVDFDGAKTYGLHVCNGDYPDEGSATLCEFNDAAMIAATEGSNNV